MTDDARIRAALPTISELRGRGARARALLAPRQAERAAIRSSRSRPVSRRLSELIGKRVHQAPEVVGPEVRRGVARLEAGELLVLENLRFEPGETQERPGARARAGLARRGLSWTTRSAPSTAPMPARSGSRSFLRPAVAGHLLEREVTTLDGPDRGPRAPAGRGARRRQGQRQDRADRALSRARRHAPDRRRDVLQLLPRAGQAHRRLAGRGGGRGAGAPGAGTRRGVRLPAAACRSTSCWATASTPTPSAASSDGIAGARRLDGARHRAAHGRGLRARGGGRRHACSGTARWARSRWSRSPPARARWRRRWPRRRASRSSAAAISAAALAAVRPGRQRHAPLHRRGRVTGTAGGQAAARTWRRWMTPERAPDTSPATGRCTRRRPRPGRT